jgi:phospholipase C
VSRLLLPRRDLLKGLAASGLGAGAFAACAPPAPARKPTAQERGQIDTIVFCMMENRSFDHVFGSLSLLEGRTEIDGLRPEHVNLDLDGNEFGPTETTTMCVEDPPHGWSSSRTQFGEGRNDGFVRAFQESRGLSAPASTPMEYLTRAQQPVSYALADGSALCQRWFSSVLTSTWPNRLYLHATQSQGIGTNDFPIEGKYTCRTIWDQLTEAGISWRYYYSDLPTLTLFARADWAPNLSTIDRFHADAAAGNLPQVVCVEPGAGYNDDHPPHHPMLGQLFLGSVYQSLAQSPQWSRSLFMYTYDEAGGFFDHVAPGRMPDDFARDDFDQLGFRVPAVVTGPYVRNVVDDTTFDHSAVARFIQDHFGIEERLTRRNAAAADLSVLLDADALAAGTPAPPVALPRFTQTEDEVEEECRRVQARTGQPELQAAVQAMMPHLDLTGDLPAYARRTWRRARDLGLWVP